MRDIITEKMPMQGNQELAAVRVDIDKLEAENEALWVEVGELVGIIRDLQKVALERELEAEFRTDKISEFVDPQATKTNRGVVG